MTVPVECAAVVKADAYGCGLEQVAPALIKVGCRTFFVADVAEGRRLRAVAPNAVIYVLNGVLPNTGPSLAAANLRPVINSTTELAEWDTFVANDRLARRSGTAHRHRHEPARALTPDESVAIAPRMQNEGHGFTLLMSHLACAETPDHPMNDKQIRLFREIRILFRGVSSSFANSAGIFLGGTVHCDLVRPGIALYGGNPFPGKNEPDAAGGRAEGPHRPGAQRQEGRQRRLWRGLDRGAAESRSRSSRPAMATAISVPPPPPRARPRRR